VAERHEDYRALFPIISEAVDEIQRRLAQQYAPGLGRLNESLGRWDEALADALVRVALRYAWFNAQRGRVIGPAFVRVCPQGNRI
jgi:hypothetical protein